MRNAQSAPDKAPQQSTFVGAGRVVGRRGCFPGRERPDPMAKSIGVCANPDYGWGVFSMIMDPVRLVSDRTS